MREEQEGIATELPAFLAALRAGGGVAQDFHVGVVTTSVYLHADTGSQVQLVDYANFGQAGRLRVVPETDGERVLRGDDPDLAAKFSRLVQQGTTGSGQETPFEAALLAVTPPLSTRPQAEGGNDGFLRDGARLLVVLVTDEDDCSERARPPKVVIGTDSARDYCTEQAAKLTPVEEYVSLFRSLTDSQGNPREVLWASIAPVALSDLRAELVVENGQVRNVDCPNSQGPGLRQRAMAEAFDPRVRNLDSICRSSYRDSLIRIAAIANANQVVEVSNVPDPALLQVKLTRADDTTQFCTVAGGGISYEPPTAQGQKGRVRFSPDCPRRTDDKRVELQLICVQ
jgi:hypothetical protein